MSGFRARVYDAVRRLPAGRVASYGLIAEAAGRPGAARQVGQALHALPEDTDVPWWRVLAADGRIALRAAPHAARLQRALLEDEGVRFDEHGHADMRRFGWTGGQLAALVRELGDVPTKDSVSLAIRPEDGSGRVLLVRRPPDDEDLPDAWGLPAASLRAGESREDAARRAAREKLGVEVEPGEVLNEGSAERAEYTLHMWLVEARITAGEPLVPQPHPGVTQYTDWRWGVAAELEPAAARGSLCSRLYLEV